MILIIKWQGRWGINFVPRDKLDFDLFKFDDWMDDNPVKAILLFPDGICYRRDMRSLHFYNTFPFFWKIGSR